MPYLPEKREPGVFIATDQKGYRKQDQLSKWDLFYLGLAEYYSTASKDPSTKVGSVVISADNRLLTAGFNGFPKGVKDYPERYEDRVEKYKYVCHAEMNAITLAECSLRGGTIYVWPFMPCANCMKAIIQAGIIRVVAPVSERKALERWKEDFEITCTMADEAGVIIDFRE